LATFHAIKLGADESTLRQGSRYNELEETIMTASHTDFDLFAALVEQAPDAMIYADRDGVIRVWNQRAETLFGHAAADAVGQNLDLIIPERLRAAHWQGFHAAVASGQTRHGGEALTTRSLHKRGDKLYVSMSFSLIKNAAGEVIGSLAVGRDVTAQQLAARADKS
jgi:PAS domain S-box-containing protein